MEGHSATQVACWYSLCGEIGMHECDQSNSSLLLRVMVYLRDVA